MHTPPRKDRLYQKEYCDASDDERNNKNEDVGYLKSKASKATRMKSPELRTNVPIFGPLRHHNP